ncbi:MAG: acyltransferase [Phycisphaerales bacterium]|nr:acyltransferase [Phycisphaerae bacterium]NNF42468.1 acyltransferase [Phycisphaerales bacterium]NNM26073.1 acyltransferase [Phycisphaerales bacterium]
MTLPHPTPTSETPPGAGTTRVVELPPRRVPRWRRLLRRVTAALRAVWWRHRLAAFGAGSRLEAPERIYGGAGIAIGRGVHVWRGARLETHRPEDDLVRLRIEDGCVIHPHAHITAAASVRIDAGALLASHVYITDHDHDAGDEDDPPVSNRRLVVAPTRIGAGAWLGERVMVLKGVTIGAHSVIGAGSVVTRDVPAGVVAAGVPARVIRTLRPDADEGRIAA